MWGEGGKEEGRGIGRWRGEGRGGGRGGVDRIKEINARGINGEVEAKGELERSLV